MLTVGVECCAGCGKGAVEPEAVKDAMHVAARTDALDDLLAEVAALGEVKGAGLGGLLGEFAVADVGAVEGCSFEQAEPFAALLLAWGCAGFEESF